LSSHSLRSPFFFFMTPPPPTSTLFHYTTLFRSNLNPPAVRLQVDDFVHRDAVQDDLERVAGGDDHETVPLTRRLLHILLAAEALDRKSTRLNSSDVASSYAVFYLKKKK